MNSMPLMPNEEVLWDANQVPFGHYSGVRTLPLAMRADAADCGVQDTVLALPKLNLQFLTIHDYLLRSFQLFRLEACYEVRTRRPTPLRRPLLTSARARMNMRVWTR